MTYTAVIRSYALFTLRSHLVEASLQGSLVTIKYLVLSDTLHNSTENNFERLVCMIDLIAAT